MERDFRRMGGMSRRRFMVGAGAALGAAVLPMARTAGAEPHDDRVQWIANFEDTRLVAADGTPAAWLPRWTRMRIMRGLPGWIEVWVPRFGIIGRVAPNVVGPVPAPSPEDLAKERAEQAGPDVIDAIGLPARVVGGGNLRLWPASRQDTFLRTLGHNAPIRAIASVQGDDGEEWYEVEMLDAVTASEAIGAGYIHHSLVRLPRLHPPVNPDRLDGRGKWFTADLRDPAILVAFEGSAPVWSALTLKGTSLFRTPTGEHKIVRRVANETMNSETLYPPIPRDAPGGYYLKNVLWTQYFTWDGASIHYNYWSSNFGYAGSHGCLGVGYNEAKFAWEWADVGTSLHVFA